MTTRQRVPVKVVAAMLATAALGVVVAQGPAGGAVGGVQEAPSAEVATQLKLAGDLLAKQDAVEAEKVLRAAVAGDRTMVSKRALADFLMNRRLTAEALKEVLGLLTELSADRGEGGAGALTVGLMRRLVPAGEAGAWLERLREHPGATPLMLLGGDQVEVQMRPEAKAEIAAKTVKRVEGGAVGDREDAVRWLAEIGEFKLALPLLSREEALLDQGKFGAWAGPRMALDSWGEVLEVLGSAKLPVPGPVQKLLRGRALIGTGKADEGRGLCREACLEAKAKPGELAELLALLGSLREPELFEEELGKGFADAGAAEAVLKAVVPVVRRSRDANVLHRFYELAVASPVLGKDPEVRARLSHYGMMIGKREPVAELAARLDESPLAPGPRVTYVLGLVEDGKAEQAMRELEIRKPPLEESRLEPFQAAVIAGVLAGSGHGQEAAAMAGRLPVALLTKQEAEWLGEQLEKSGLFKKVEEPGVVAEVEASGWQRSLARYGFDLLLVAGVYVLWVIWQKFIRKSA